MIRRRRLLMTVLTVLLGVTGVGVLALAVPWSRGVVVEIGAIGATPASFDDSFQAGLRALQAGQVGDAARAFEAAARLDPNSPEAQVNLGFAYLMADRNREAIDAFGRAVDLRPGQVNAYYGLAEAQEQNGDLPAAVGAMRTFIHLAADDDPFRRRAMAAVWEWETAMGTATTDPTPASSVAASPTMTTSTALPQAHRSAAQSLHNVRLIDVAGRIVSLDRYAGKTIVMNVWATWCGPCRAELASLQRLSDRLDPRNAIVIGVSIDKDPVFVREYLREVGLKFDNYVDSKQSVTRDLLGTELVPYTLLIGPDGIVRDRQTGIQDWDKVDVSTLMAEHAFRLAGKE